MGVSADAMPGRASQALICRADGTVEALDLATATPEELAAAITDHRELEIVRKAIQASDHTTDIPKETP